MRLAAELTQTAMPIHFTIGHEHATQPAFVAPLRGAGVEVLADNRYPRLSRRPCSSSFSRSSCTVSAIKGPPPILLKWRRKA